MSPEQTSSAEFKDEPFVSPTEQLDSKPSDPVTLNSNNEQKPLNQCPVCRASIEPGADICKECGQPL